MALSIIKPNDRYRGRSYSQWIEEWSNLLVSSSPDYQRSRDMFFLRGNLDYESDQSGIRTIKPGKFFDRSGSLGVTIYGDTALFIPVLTAMYSINDPYDAKQLLDEEDLRYAVRTDLAEGRGMWLRFKDPGTAKYKPLLPTAESILDYYFETAVFTLRVSSQSPLIDKFETALGPGEYESVQGGYYVIITNLPAGSYRFHFGGNGRGYYYTDAVYDITVLQEKARNLVTDESKKDLPSGGKSQQEKAIKTYRHLKTEDDIETTLPFP